MCENTREGETAAGKNSRTSYLKMQFNETAGYSCVITNYKLIHVDYKLCIVLKPKGHFEKQFDSALHSWICHCDIVLISNQI